MANILGKILSGFGQGYLSHARKREADQLDAKQWEIEKQRKRETLDLQDEYSQRSEARQRQNRVADNDAAYSKTLSRAEQFRQKKLQQIKDADPARWNSDPAYQKEIMAHLDGYSNMMPKLPNDPKIVELVTAGKLEEALKVAANSANPDSLDFYNKMVAAITHNQKYRNAAAGGAGSAQRGYKPDSNFIQSALNRGNQTPALDEKRARQVRQVRDDAAKELVSLRAKYSNAVGDFDPSLMGDTEDADKYREIEDRYNKATRMLNGYSDNVLGIQQPIKSGGNAFISAAQSRVDEILSSKAPPTAGAQNPSVVARSTEAKPSPGILERVLGYVADTVRPQARVGASNPSLQGAAALPAPAPSQQPSAQEAARAQKFNALVNTISAQLKRQLSDDERGFIASGIYDGGFDNLVFDFERGTYTKPNAASKEAVSDLVTSGIGDFAAENLFQTIPNARSSLAKFLRGSVLTDKGVEAFSR